MQTLTELVRMLKPDRTVLFLGAGASVPSGAPIAFELGRQLSAKVAGESTLSDDFVETCSILDHRYGRAALVAAIRGLLTELQPTGGLLAIPEFEWSALYTTNFDRLLELSYRQARKALIVIRSNFEYSKTETQQGTFLFKIHGDISQDVVDGAKSGMLLTERDYDQYGGYRQTLFARLGLDMLTKDVLILGYSIRDPHLRNDMNQAARLHSTQQTPGRLLALIYERDEDRAALLEQKGFTIAFGGIDELMHELSSARPEPTLVYSSDTGDSELPLRLRASTVDVAHARTLESKPAKLFNGSPATYADIAAKLTISRSVEPDILVALKTNYFVSLVGVAGVGKTTLARRLLLAMVDEGVHCWEHRSEFPLIREEWKEVERRLRHAGQMGVLFVDECPIFMSQVNALADYIAGQEQPALRLLLTANNSQWRPRTKSPALFASGAVKRLSYLTESDIEQLVNLIERQSAIRQLVDQSFARLSRKDQIYHLRRRCRADFYVCLKNIFATDALDTILLREYAELHEALQDVYRHVAALEATGMQVHRQLIIRILGIDAGTIRALLDLLEGIVDEFDIAPWDGIYGWATRHRVIAQVVSRYKFAGQEERYSLLERVLRALNPTEWLELRAIRDLCEREYGVGGLTDHQQQIRLYRMMIAIAPGERIPRHRLIGKLLQLDEYDLADQEIRAAEETVGLDPPISRYKVRWAIRRAEATAGILEEDRRAMLMEAERLALKSISRFPKDKYAYISYAEVAVSLAELAGDYSLADRAVSALQKASEQLLDPQLAETLDQLTRMRSRAGDYSTVLTDAEES